LVILLNHAGRGIRIAIYPSVDFYLAAPDSLLNAFFQRFLYWIPVTFGMLSYAYITFHWSEVVHSFTSRHFLGFLRKPVFYFYHLYTPIILVLCLISVWVNYPEILIICSLIAFAYVLISLEVFYYGTKVLRLLIQSNKITKAHSHVYEKKLTFFVLIAGTLCVAFVIFLAGGAYLFTVETPDSTTILALFYVSYIFNLIICAIFVMMIYKPKKERTPSRKSEPKDLEESKKLSTNGSKDELQGAFDERQVSVDEIRMEEFMKNRSSFSDQKA